MEPAAAAAVLNIAGAAPFKGIIGACVVSDQRIRGMLRLMRAAVPPPPPDEGREGRAKRRDVFSSRNIGSQSGTERVPLNQSCCVISKHLPGLDRCAG